MGPGAANSAAALTRTAFNTILQGRCLSRAELVKSMADFRRGEALLDPEIAQTVDGILHHQGMRVVTGATFVRAEQSGARKRLVVRVDGSEQVLKGDALPLHVVPRALGNRDADGLFKVVADAHTDEVLGVHVVASGAGDSIYAGLLAVKFHLTVRDLTDTFAPYLTMSEGLKLAAQSFSRDPAKLSCCAA